MKTPPLNWNEIKSRALNFSKEWEDESRERAEAQSFWNDFFEVFGVTRRRLATFEQHVKKLDGKPGRIDLFWKGTLLVEHKSTGANLDAAFEQAADYFHGLEEHELPKYILVSDFQEFRLYDLDERKQYDFALQELHKNVKYFGFIAGYKKRAFKEQDPVNIAAAEKMGRLRDLLEDSGYAGHDLEVYLVRLLFCLFADDTAIFNKDTFRELIELKTREDGSDLGSMLAYFFEILNTPAEERQSTLNEQLAVFPYVNGKLFEERLRMASFNSDMRTLLLECCALDWGLISPAIFGSLFQSAMDPEERRNLGAHYTSEKNILKLIKSLFLDELREEFLQAKKANTPGKRKSELSKLQAKLGRLKFMDPACGCGNFLIIAYREIRLLELDLLKEIYGEQQAFEIDQIMNVNVDQFFGVEYDEFAARIAEVALWLIDHQVNMVVSEAFGEYYERLPLRKSATIVHGNALRLNWEDVVPKDELSYILGNPPFYGKQYQSAEQKEDLKLVFQGVKNAGVLDYVAGWYVKAAKLIQGTEIKVGFVSTNSIAQGEQTGVLWNALFNTYGIKIHFAHQTFRWRNEARGNAAVYVVIIGFANFDTKEKHLFEYENITGDPLQKKARNINPYLVEGEDLVVLNRTSPICKAPPMNFGSMPNDGGHLLLDDEEKAELLRQEPEADQVIKPLRSAREVLNNIPRWCIWLKDVPPQKLRKLKRVGERVEKVKQHRLNSTRAATRELAATPGLFGEIRQPDSDYVFVPRTTSEHRPYIPMVYFDSLNIPNDSSLFIENATLYEFGVLHSEMHMTWARYVCGRLKGDYRYSNKIVYNNYPWPESPSDKNKAGVKDAAQRVLDVRASYPESSLADLYDANAMPADLRKAHKELDKAVDKCYRAQAFPNEQKRIEFLFSLYEQYVRPMLKSGQKKRGNKNRK